VASLIEINLLVIFWLPKRNYLLSDDQKSTLSVNPLPEFEVFDLNLKQWILMTTTNKPSPWK